MKAITLDGFGGPENLKSSHIPIPGLSDDEVLIEVKAIGINPVDIKTRLGRGVAERLKPHRLIILGWDVSGVVIRSGDMVTTFKKGDEVFGMINFPGHGKAYAEYVPAPEGQIAIKPPNISFEEAAATPLAALTAWQVLTEKLKVKHGDKILIHSGAGGVGHFAIQMARHLGAFIATTASEKNKDFVLGLGASFYVDYEKMRFEELLKGMDYVIDTIGGENFERSLKVLKPGGTVLVLPSGSDPVLLAKKASDEGKTALTFLVRSSGTDMKQIADLLRSGAIKSYVSKKYTLDEIPLAHLQIESGHTRGKLVVKI